VHEGAREPEPRDEPPDDARLESGQLGGADPLVPPGRHVPRFTPGSPLVERKRLVAPFPVLERAARIVERRRRRHHLDQQQIRISLRAHVRLGV
jgi:hypothetical protein